MWVSQSVVVWGPIVFSDSFPLTFIRVRVFNSSYTFLAHNSMTYLIADDTILLVISYLWMILF